MLIKAYFSMKPAKKKFSLLGGKIKFELALQPSSDGASTASTSKIQIQFSRYETEDILAGFIER